MKRSLLAILVIYFVLFRADNASAYIDPASGSYIFQILLAGLLGALYALKVYWKSFKAFIGRLFGKNSKDDDSVSS